MTHMNHLTFLKMKVIYIYIYIIESNCLNNISAYLSLKK